MGETQERKAGGPATASFHAGGVRWIGLWILLAACVALEVPNIVDYARGEVSGLDLTRSLLGPAVLGAWIGATLWRVRRRPVLRVSGWELAWESPCWASGGTLAFADVAAVQRVDRAAVVLGTRNGQAIRVGLEWLSRKDREAVLALVRRRVRMRRDP